MRPKIFIKEIPALLPIFTKATLTDSLATFSWPPENSQDGFREQKNKELFREMSESVNKTAFVLKEEQEFCFLYNEEDPFEIFRALMEQAGKPDSGLTRGEAYEIMEGMIPERLKSI